jgi:hypothetical protein
MLRREIPDGDPGAIFDRALTLLLEEVARPRWRPRRPGPDRITAPGSRHIPAAVKRAVWFRIAAARACVEARPALQGRSFLELHHIQPYALGARPRPKTSAALPRAQRARGGDGPACAPPMVH